MTIRCSQGHENPDAATYCDECGEPLPASASASAGEQEQAPTMPAGEAIPQPAPDEAPTQTAPGTPASAGETTTQAGPGTPPPADEAATQVAPPAPPAQEPEAAAAPSAPQAAPAPVAAQPRLLVEGTSATFDLANKTSVVVGREDIPSNSFPDIDLTPYGAEEGGVSRLHARITQSGDAWAIEDLESTNFTFVNRKRIPPKTPNPLNDGDEIRLGRVGLRFKMTA
jgi:hypothetical protein